MNRIFRAVMALLLVAVVASCGGKPAPAPSKFKSYDGPPVTQVVVKKGQRQMYLISGQKVLKSYQIGLGFQPVGPKQYEGDGRTPEGVYYIDRLNPNSIYHLSLGISYPSPEDRRRAEGVGLRPGGDIMIHGFGQARSIARKGKDWTAGCIAVDDEEIEDIFAMLRPGVPVVIYP